MDDASNSGPKQWFAGGISRSSCGSEGRASLQRRVSRPDDALAGAGAHFDQAAAPAVSATCSDEMVSESWEDSTALGDTGGAFGFDEPRASVALPRPSPLDSIAGRAAEHCPKPLSGSSDFWYDAPMQAQPDFYDAARSSDDAKAYQAARLKRLALEKELAVIRAERQHCREVLNGLDVKVRALRGEVDRQRGQKPIACGSCKTVAVQVDAAAQSLLGAVGYIANELMRGGGADRAEMLNTVLCYVDPAKHLDPELEALYHRVSACGVAVRRDGGRPAQVQVGETAKRRTL